MNDVVIPLSSEEEFQQLRKQHKEYSYNRIRASFTCSNCGETAIKTFRCITTPFLCSVCAKSIAHRTEEYFNRYRTSMKQKYGVESPLESQEIKQKCKNTVQRRYGVDNPFQSEMCKAKSRMTNLSKIGVEYPGQSIICRNKGIDTYFHRTGYRHNMLNPDSKNRVFETTIEHFGAIGFASKKIKKKQVDTLKTRYGVETYSQTSEFAKKYIETVTKRFGCSHPCKTPEVQQKIKQTNLSKYGFENCMQNLLVRHRSISNKHRGKYKYDGEIFDSTWEIAYYIWLSDNKIEFKYHPDVDITYEYNGHMCIYKPDFIVNGELHEIKGNHFFSNKQITGELVCPYNAMMNGKMSAKYKCMKKHNVKILLHDDIKPYITYVKNTYGKTYLSRFKCK